MENEVILKHVSTDDWGRPVYSDMNGLGIVLVDTNLGDGLVDLHTVSSYGEPIMPVSKHKVLSKCSFKILYNDKVLTLKEMGDINTKNVRYKRDLMILGRYYHDYEQFYRWGSNSKYNAFVVKPRETIEEFLEIYNRLPQDFKPEYVTPEVLTHLKSKLNQ